MSNISVFLVNFATEIVQVYTHGAKYSCPMKQENDKYYFRFKDTWHNLEDCVDEFTRYVK